MKLVKSICLTVVFVAVSISVGNAGLVSSVITGIQSIVTYPERALVTEIENEGKDVFEIEGNLKDYKPQRGGIKVCKAENVLIIGFYLSQKNIDFYNQKFSDGQRKPIGLEIDVIDNNKVFKHSDLESVTISTQSGNSFNGEFYLDNPICDLGTVHTIGIGNPSNLTPNQWYYVTFQFSDHKEVSTATFQLQEQLVGDVWNLRDDKYDNFSSIVKSGLYIWFGSAGYENIPANNYFNITTPFLEFSRDKFFGWEEGIDTGYDRVVMG